MPACGMDVRRTDQIADALDQLILTGEFQDGARLDETRLAQRFGVSRTPVREALQRLGGEGLVEHRPRRGVFVRAPGPVELMEMFELMAELEAACGRLAASRITEDGLRDLAEANRGCEDAATLADAEAYYAANGRFHHLIYGHAGNAFLEAEAERWHKRLRGFRRLQLRLRGRMAQSLAEHREVLEALGSGNEIAAADALRRHVAVQGEKFQRLRASMA